MIGFLAQLWQRWADAITARMPVPMPTTIAVVEVPGGYEVTVVTTISRDLARELHGDASAPHPGDAATAYDLGGEG